MEPCDIRDAGLLSSIVSRDMGVDSIMYIRGTLLNGAFKYFMEENFVIQYQIIAEGKVMIHIYGSPLSSLRDTRNFVLLSGSWMMDNTGTEDIVAFCKKDNMRLRYLIRECGGHKVGELPDDLIYSWSQGRREELEGRNK